METPDENLSRRELERDYYRLIGTLNAFTGMVLLSVTKFRDNVKGRIITNFMARGMVCLESISALWKLGNWEDCWALHRALLDRLFHLWYLSDTDEFELFEKWSFVQEYEAKHRTHCDPHARQKLPPEEVVFTQAETRRYQRLKREGITFKKPRPEKIAKKMDLPFLYAYGYDFGSRHVHPMASDGVDATRRILDKTQKRSTRDLVVLQNSILIQTLILQTGMRASELLWLRPVHDFLNQSRSALENGSVDYGQSFLKLARIWPATDICRPTEGR